MKLNVLFFGATADAVGKRTLEFETENDLPARAIFERVLAEHPALRNHRLLFSVNQQYLNPDQTVHDGDELAIFTAVSGG